MLMKSPLLSQNFYLPPKMASTAKCDAPFLQREDARRAATGKVFVIKKVEEEGAGEKPSIRAACAARGTQ